MSSERETTPAFEVTFGCENCGDEWGQEFPARTVIREDNNTQAFAKDCETLGTVQCECCRTIRCPTCELVESVTVNDRTPIEEGDDAE